MNVKLLSLLLLVALLAGCATPSSVESRKKERYAAYSSLTPELRESVDQGKIKAGMTSDAVYIAWGAPSQTLQSGNAAGEATTWVYEGGYMEENRYWGRRRMYYDYTPRTFVRAEVTFMNGLVKEWHTMPQPVY